MTNQTPKRIAIVIPVFDDWQPLSWLIEQLDRQAESSNLHFYIFVIDDGSPQPLGLDVLSTSRHGHSELHLIRLSSNLGHQRAIAVGLVLVSQIEKIEATIVMDADGQDRPEDVVRLAAAWSEDTNRIVVAQRAARSEGLAFIFLYAFYKLTFRILTGHRIDFGNFCLLPRDFLRALTYHPSLWNNLAATIARSRIPRTPVRTVRGVRLAGKSHMNFEGLILHGVGAMAVYADVVLLRIFFGACILGSISVFAIAGVAAIRLGTTLAIPGWASYLATSLVIIFLQSVLMSTIAVFQLMSFRSMRAFVPALDATSFVSGSITAQT